MIYLDREVRGGWCGLGRVAAWRGGTLGSVSTLFAQYVAGYVGSSVEHRGKDAEAGAVWSMAELQALLDEWVVDRFTDRSARSNPLTCCYS